MYDGTLYQHNGEWITIGRLREIREKERLEKEKIYSVGIGMTETNNGVKLESFLVSKEKLEELQNEFDNSEDKKLKDETISKLRENEIENSVIFKVEEENNEDGSETTIDQEKLDNSELVESNPITEVVKKTTKEDKNSEEEAKEDIIENEEDEITLDNIEEEDKSFEIKKSRGRPKK
jgi:hypothetical protein